MDNETKQIFEQLIEAINNNRVDSSQLVEAVEKLNGPDWGMIILTTINIVAFILVAYAQLKQQKYQTKLQEQQNKQQEYELYLGMYRIVNNMDTLIAEHITTLIAYYGMFRNAAHENFTTKISCASKCIEELDNRWLDFELKFPQEKDIVEKYRSVITEMQSTYNLINNLVIFETEENRDVRKIRMRCRGLSCNDDYETKVVLLSLLSNRSTKKRLDICLSNFLKDKEELKKRNLLGKIAKHCNPE